MIASLLKWVVLPYMQLQDDDFLVGKLFIKSCGEESSPNAPDFLDCSMGETCKVTDSYIYFSQKGRDGKALIGVVVERQWRMYDGGVVYLQFEPYREKNRY